jgi:hypothetical protein
VQSILTFELVTRVVAIFTLYFSQRHPEELGRFRWIVDAKDRVKTTDWEDWWRPVIGAAIQAQMFKDPMPMLEEADYTHFSRFEAPMPPYLRALAPERLRDKPAINFSRLLNEDFQFSGESDLELELVDVVTNATRRTMAGNLQRSGWIGISSHMVANADQAIVIHEFDSETRTVPRPYGSVVKTIGAGGRPVFAPRFRGT